MKNKYTDYDLKRKVEKLLHGISEEIITPVFLRGNRYLQTFKIDDLEITFFWKGYYGYKYIDSIRKPDGTVLNHSEVDEVIGSGINILMDMPYLRKRQLDEHLENEWYHTHVVTDEGDDEEDETAYLLSTKANRKALKRAQKQADKGQYAPRKVKKK